MVPQTHPVKHDAFTVGWFCGPEQAALPSGVIYTDATADAEASQVEPMDTVEMDRGTWMTMPFGWKIRQVKMFSGFPRVNDALGATTTVPRKLGGDRVCYAGRGSGGR